MRQGAVREAFVAGLVVAPIVLSFGLASRVEARAERWPAGKGSEIGRVGRPAGLPDGYEPSGIVWHPQRRTLLIVGDSGELSELDPAGGALTTWRIGGDLEAVALADPESSLVYLGREDPDSILEFDLSTGELTANVWDLTRWMRGEDNLGLEALTWVDSRAYAGHQGDGRIYVFSLLPGGDVRHLETLSPWRGRSGLSGLTYDPDTRTLYAVYGTSNALLELTPAGGLLRHYELPGSEQEGIAIVKACPLGRAAVFVAEDSSEVWRYDGYPIRCDEPLDAPARRVSSTTLLVGLLSLLAVAIGWARHGR